MDAARSQSTRTAVDRSALLARRAIELTFTEPYRMDLPKAFCSVIRTEYPEILWATGRVPHEDIPRFGGVQVPTGSTGPAERFQCINLVMVLNGVEHQIEIVMAPALRRASPSAADAEPDDAVPSSILAVLEELCNEFRNGQGRLLTFWDRRSSEPPEPPELRCQVMGGRWVAVQPERCEQYRGEIAVRLGNLREAERRLEREAATAAEGSDAHFAASQELAFVRFRREMYDYLELYLPGLGHVLPSPREVRATFFYVYDPWQLSYSYRGLVPDDFKEEQWSALHDELHCRKTGLQVRREDNRVQRVAPLKDVLSETDLDELRKQFARDAKPTGQLCVQVLQRVQQDFDTGLLAVLHQADDVLTMWGQLPSFVPPPIRRGRGGDNKADQVRDYEVALLRMGGTDDDTWVASPIRSHGQVRGLWFVQVPGGEPGQPPSDTAVSVAVRESISTTGMSVVASLGDMLDSVLIRQFQSRAFGSLEHGWGGLSEEARGLAHGLPALVNTTLSGYAFRLGSGNSGRLEVQVLGSDSGLRLSGARMRQLDAGCCPGWLELVESACWEDSDERGLVGPVPLALEPQLWAAMVNALRAVQDGDEAGVTLRGTAHTLLVWRLSASDDGHHFVWAVSEHPLEAPSLHRSAIERGAELARWFLEARRSRTIERAIVERESRAHLTHMFKNNFELYSNTLLAITKLSAKPIPKRDMDTSPQHAVFVQHRAFQVAFEFLNFAPAQNTDTPSQQSTCPEDLEQLLVLSCLGLLDQGKWDQVKFNWTDGVLQGLRIGDRPVSRPDSLPTRPRRYWLFLLLANLVRNADRAKPRPTTIQVKVTRTGVGPSVRVEVRNICRESNVFRRKRHELQRFIDGETDRHPSLKSGEREIRGLHLVREARERLAIERIFIEGEDREDGFCEAVVHFELPVEAP